MVAGSVGREPLGYCRSNDCTTSGVVLWGFGIFWPVDEVRSKQKSKNGNWQQATIIKLQGHTAVWMTTMAPSLTVAQSLVSAFANELRGAYQLVWGSGG